MGSERAFQEFVRKYHATVFYQTLTFTRSHADTEEITQDIFMKIWEQRIRLPEIINFKDYLFILARNHIISAMRKQVMQTQVHTDQLPEEALLPDQQYEVKEIQALMIKGMEQLTPQQQTVFRLSRLEHLNHDQIAVHMNISKHAVNWHMVKALNTLRHYFGRYGGGILAILWGWCTGR